MSSTKLAMTVAALALGTALSALPAMAQDYHYPVGRGANDGGQIKSQVDQAGPTSGSAANRQAKQSRNDAYAFGSQGQPPGRGVYNYNPSTANAAPAQYKYPMGRGANDGGQIRAQLDQAGPTSGSAANRQAKQSRNDAYAFGAQGQPQR